ncbi:MAG: hypothetical protein IV105_05380 [Rhizobacter sp.]|nr:hypothetical protein [Rhizobacter sp.]
MNRTHPQAAHPLAPPYPAGAPTDAIEWEDMPSLVAPRLVPTNAQRAPTQPMLRTQVSDFNTAWGVTMPAHLDTPAQAAPYREAIRGLVTREVNEPDLFKQFFG